LRIGIVTENYYPSVGGIQEHVHHFAREARRLGHSVKIITSRMPDLGQPDHHAPDEPDVLRVARSRPILMNGSFGRVSGGPRVASALREVLARERFDIVHIHGPLNPVLPLLAVHYATGPLVGTFHTHFRPGVFFRLERRRLQRYLDRLDAAVAVSRACLSAFRGRLLADFHIIPNGVDAERFSRGRRLRRFADGKFNVLWVGRLEPRNGLDRMLAAFLRVWRQVDARLIVVGDGPLLPRYQAKVPREVAEDVVFAGALFEERPDYYASADVLCAPTSIASFGVTLLEAMAAGKPILASDIDGYREVMQHGREGELIDPSAVEGWARAILRLAREPARAAAYAERGRQAAARYAWPIVAHRILGLYRTIGVRG
jgi:phosphatidylinositol alpha-mannosyltransferase